ncbi:MAG: sulfotransferase [Planctomycetota bacterium]
MKEFNLIMISAMYENGGNTTHRMLDGHPELHVYPFESQVGTGMNNDFLSSYVPIRYRWPEFPMNSTPEADYEAFWDEELKTYLRVPGRSKFKECGMVMDEKKRRARFAEILKEKGRTRATLVEAFFRSTFDTWENLNKTGQERFCVGYNPVQVLDAEKILSDFPRGHVIHVCRNPYAGYADQFRRPFPPSLERYAHTWGYCQYLALTFKRKYPGRFHIMRFEDMVADRKGTISTLLAGIGLPFSEKCLVPSFNAVELKEIKPWGTIRTPTPEENMRTANELSAEQKKGVRDLTAVSHQLMGYDQFLETGRVEPIRF